MLSIFDEERKKEAEEQRKGLCLAGLFPKPRPMWMAPAFVAAFGDAFVEKSTLEVRTLSSYFIFVAMCNIQCI